MKIFLILLCVCGVVFGACNHTKKENISNTINAPTAEVYIEQVNEYAVIIPLANGNTEEAKKQLEELKLSDLSYNSILGLAAELGNTEIAKLAIEKGANVNENAAGKFHPLTLAAINGRVDTVKALVEAGADVNALDIALGPNNNATSIISSKNIYEYSVLNLVLERQKNIKESIAVMQNKKNETKEEELKEQEKNISEVIKILKAAGAKNTEKFLYEDIIKTKNR